MQIVSAEMFSGKSGQRYVDTDIEKLQHMENADGKNNELLQLLTSLKKYWQEAQQQQSQSAANVEGAGPLKGGLTMPFTTKDQAMSAGPNQYNGYAHSFAGMGVQFILFLGIDAGISILLAQRMGLWSRLLAAPISTETLLLARAMSSALIAFCILSMLLSVAVLFFHAGINGSLLGLLGVMACFALMAASYGLLIAAFGKTPEAARSLSIFATLIMVMLGGAWVPSFVFPQWLQTATLVVPTRWAVDGLDAMTWRGLGIDQALPAMGVQLGFALLFGGLAFWKFRQDR
jgi:ABC-2 type transport system permease protein